VCFLFVVHKMLFPMFNILCTFTVALSEVFMQCQIWLFSVVTLFRAFPVCGSGIFWMIFKWLLLLFCCCCCCSSSSSVVVVVNVVCLFVVVIYLASVTC
jgi:hypothetical protein